MYSLDSRTSFCCFAGINEKGVQVNLLKRNIDVNVFVVVESDVSVFYLCCSFLCNNKDKFKRCCSLEIRCSSNRIHFNACFVVKMLEFLIFHIKIVFKTIFQFTLFTSKYFLYEM